MTRTYDVPKGMALEVFESKYARRVVEEDRFQTWAERVHEVVEGNFAVLKTKQPMVYRQHFEQILKDKAATHTLATAGVLPFSGRHLQHGDMDQPNKMGESFTNCSSAMFSFTKFWLLLKGSGVGRSYDSEICRVDWRNLPNCYFVMDGPDQWGYGGHPDYQDWILSRREAEHLFGSESEKVRWFKVGDSAEGWTKVVEIMETAAWQEKHKHKVYIFDFSDVRGKGVPIVGQQGRPASGPVPFLKALTRIVLLKGLDLSPDIQALIVDHHLSACVAVGGVRRAARLGCKYWKDANILEYIQIKRGGHLFTANLSVGVDKEFWEALEKPGFNQAKIVFYAATGSAYQDQTGEPAFINLDRLTWDPKGLEGITAENYISPKYRDLLKIHHRTMDMIASHLEVAKKMKYPFIVNPCGEVVFAAYGAYCLLADVCMKNAETLDEIRAAVRLAVQFVMRVNLMDFMYAAEVKRTNRVGVSLLGWHEVAWKFFGMDFHDLTHGDDRECPFWTFIRELQQIADWESDMYARMIGVEVPHHVLVMVPSGTVSKVMQSTEGAHLLAQMYMLRWVQFPKNGPEHLDLEARGYPVKDVSHQYTGHVVVGFPMEPNPILMSMPEDRLILAADAPIGDQFEWLRRIERNLFGGPGKGGQISYTIKYRQSEVDFAAFQKVVQENMPTVRCCTFDVAGDDFDASAYAYTPEERITRTRYLDVISKITDELTHIKVDDALLQCASGICPIEPNINRVA